MIDGAPTDNSPKQALRDIPQTLDLTQFKAPSTLAGSWNYLCKAHDCRQLGGAQTTLLPPTTNENYCDLMAII